MKLKIILFLLYLIFYLSCAQIYDDNIPLKETNRELFNFYENISDPSVYLYGLYEFGSYCERQQSFVYCDTHLKGKIENTTPEADVIIQQMNIFNLEIPVLKNALFLPTRSHRELEALFLLNTSTISIENGFFDDFESLTFLKLLETQLESLDEKFLTEALGSKLKILMLESSNLTHIPPTAFKNLIVLEELHLNTPVLEEIENIFVKELKNLKVLDLHSTVITHLEDRVFENLVNLETLTLSAPLASIPRDINLLPKLTTLNLFFFNLDPILAYNPHIYSESLKDLKIYFAGTLKTIDDCALCGFPNLKEFGGSHNAQLSYIHENAFGYVSSGKSKIKGFYVAGSNITTLPETLLNWDEVDDIFIAHNPIVCNCSMAWYVNWLMKNSSRPDPSINRRARCLESLGQERILMTEYNVSHCPITAANKSSNTGLIFGALTCVITLGTVLGFWAYKNTTYLGQESAFFDNVQLREKV